MVTLEEMKNYLRVDSDDDDKLIEHLIKSATRLSMDVARVDDEENFWNSDNARICVLYAAAYLYEHREEADYHSLVLTLRALLFAERKAGF